MSDQFQLDNRDLRELVKIYKNAPKQLTKMSASVLNTMVYKDYLSSMKTISGEMIIRTPGMIKKGMRYQKANYNQPISRQFAISGSIKMERHDAWEHVETGEGARITRFTKEGRGGNVDNVAKKEARAGQDKHQRASDYNLNEKNIQRFMAAVAGQKGTGKYGRRKPFFIAQIHRRMGRGIYKFVGGSVGTYKAGKRVVKKTLVGAHLVRLSTPKDWIKPRKIEWKEKATKRAITQKVIQQAWLDAGKKFLLKEIDKRFKMR